jgi:hypothetical protein
MRSFLLGFLAGLIAVALAARCYVRFGFVDPRADIPVSTLEEKIAMPSVNSSVDRRAPQIKNPIDSSNANLIAGMTIYQSDCAICHGDISHPHGALADSLYPRAPQSVEDAPDMRVHSLDPSIDSPEPFPLIHSNPLPFGV